MAHSVEKIFNKFKHLNNTKPVLIGVSGGADSVVLAHLLHESGVEIGVAHCHFNLRGADADTDQEFSRQFAENLGVPFYTVKFETQTYAETRKISIQMAARNLRYFWFEKICKENGFGQIAVGTHLTDNIETFLINSARGTGLSGLRGIKPVNGRIIRPLLEITKEDIYDYAKTEKLEWREDLSNQSIKYHRNKIRHKILPVLAEINPNLEETFQRNFKRLSRLDAFVQQQIEDVWNSWVIADGKGFRLPISELLNNEFTDVVLSYKLQPLGYSQSQIQGLIKALDGQSGSVFSSKDYKIHVDRTEVFIQPKRFFTIPDQYAITEFLGEISKPISLKFKDYHTEDLEFSSRKDIAYFDFDKLTFPLILRKWGKGDKLQPFGMKGVKKVSDLLIDAKVPLHKKENVWVLESNNQICWVIGFRSSGLFQVDVDTSHIYVVEMI